MKKKTKGVEQIKTQLNLLFSNYAYPNHLRIERIGELLSPLESKVFSLLEEKYKNKENDNSYLERCKKIGRIGPWETKLHRESAYGEAHYHGTEKLELEATSNFYTVRANVGVFSGRYYFEV